ncbi:MAG: glycosyltransferase [Chloroflexi bacterium]|nr:glycosyltransferase [Chloroflexota bacterium]
MGFSIAIPVWNDQEWLPGAIESVLRQTHPHWELVIGDNASDTDLESIVGRYADERIRYHRFPTHVGASESHNRTMALCSSEWVVLLSADDRLDPCCLSRMAQRIEQVAVSNARLAMVVTACRRVDPTGQATDILRQDYTSYRPFRFQVIPDGLYDSATWLGVNAAPGIPPWMMGSVAIPRDLLVESGAFRPEMGLSHDLELVMRLAAYGNVAYIDAPLLNYTVRGNSITGKLIKRHIQSRSAMVDFGAAWLSALHAHEARRTVSCHEREAVSAAISRAFLHRALLQRRAVDGGGVRAAIRDILHAASYSRRTVLGSWRLAVALGALLAPGWLLDRVTTIGHRYGFVVV